MGNYYASATDLEFDPLVCLSPHMFWMLRTLGLRQIKWRYFIYRPGTSWVLGEDKINIATGEVLNETINYTLQELFVIKQLIIFILLPYLILRDLIPFIKFHQQKIMIGPLLISNIETLFIIRINKIAIESNISYSIITYFITMTLISDKYNR